MNCGHVYTLGYLDETVSGGKPPAGKGVKIVCQADMTHTFEFVLQFVKCITLSPNQIIIIIELLLLPSSNNNIFTTFMMIIVINDLFMIPID